MDIRFITHNNPPGDCGQLMAWDLESAALGQSPGCTVSIWAPADSVSPSCLPPSGGLSDSPALGFSSVLPLRLPSVGFSLG